MTGTKITKTEMYRILADPNLIADLSVEKMEYLASTAIDDLTHSSSASLVTTLTTSHQVLVVGDIHGNFDSLLKIYTAFQTQGAECCVFLGDYVDRGDMGVEVLNFLLLLRCRYGSNIVLLRGNHEDPLVNEQYGFKDELEIKDLSRLQPLYERLFAALPVACIVNSTICCLHGGVPSGIQRLDELTRLSLKSLSSALVEILWNDPADFPQIEEFTQNPRGPGILQFGEKAFRAFMVANGFSKLIRGHQFYPDGFQWFFGEDLLSLFSSENYCGNVNPASVAIIHGTQIEVIIL